MVRKNRTSTISFRADESLKNFIDEKANAVGISDGLWVRGLVISEMHRPSADLAGGLHEVTETLQRISAVLEKMRINQPKVLWHVLTKIGDMDPQAATELCRSKFLD